MTMSTNPTGSSASSSFWRRERAVAVGILQAVVYVAAGATAAAAGAPDAAPVGGIAGLLSIGFAYLIRQGVFSRATVEAIGKDGTIAASVGGALQSHATVVATLVSSLSDDVRALGAGQLAPIAADVSKIGALVEDMHQAVLDAHIVPGELVAAPSVSPGLVNSALEEFGGRLDDLEAQSAPAPAAAPESPPADSTTAPAYPTPAPAAPAI